MTGFSTLSGVVLALALIATAGAVRRSPRQLHALAPPFWLLSWSAQTFALPLIVISASILLWILLQNKSLPAIHAGTLLYTITIFLFLHWRNWRIYFSLNTSQHLGITILTGLNPFKIDKSKVTKLRDIPYGSEHPRQKLDLYLPSQAPNLRIIDANANRPILLQVHGGAWITGDKGSQARPMLYYFASQGWICASINYSLAPKNKFPAMLHDTLRALNWLNTHGKKYGGDPNFIAITGGSAGGHIASLAALISGNPNREQEFHYAKFKVAAALPLYGRYDFLDQADVLGSTKSGLAKFLRTKVMPCSEEEKRTLWELASPVSMIDKHAPPFYIIHGINDSLIPVEEARHFAEKIKSVSTTEVKYSELHGAQHAFDLLSTPASEAIAIAANIFLNGIHKERYK